MPTDFRTHECAPTNKQTKPDVSGSWSLPGEDVTGIAHHQRLPRTWHVRPLNLAPRPRHLNASTRPTPQRRVNCAEYASILAGETYLHRKAVRVRELCLVGR